MKIRVKITKTVNYFHKFGIRMLLIKLVEKLLKNMQARLNNNYKNSEAQKEGIVQGVRTRDLLVRDEVSYSQYKFSVQKQYKVIWLLPPPLKGSGGQMNILRYINFLEKAGHKCVIYFYNMDSRSGPVKKTDLYTQVKADIHWLENSSIPESDAIFATTWKTAYAVQAANTKAKKFYFIQDFEPYFYAPGGLQYLAERTYNFGFYGITAGEWLASKLRTEYSMKAESVSFGVDPGIYSYDNKEVRKEILFYARHQTARRGFHVGILALKLFHEKHPEIIINFVGSDSSYFPIPFKYINHKLLNLKDLNKLYNRCSAALVLSFTNFSLLPLELLGSGTIPVVNKGPNNEMVSNNPYIKYSSADPENLAATLSEIVMMENSTSYAEKAADSVKNLNWDVSGNEFVEIFNRRMNCE